MSVLVLSYTTGYQLRSFDEAARSLGIELIFATDRCHQLDDPWQDRAIAVRFHEPESSMRAVLASPAAPEIDGVIAVGDRPVVTAARVAEALGLSWHSVAGAAASSDKRRSRALLAEGGLLGPRFRVLPLAAAMISGGSVEELKVDFPCVLKPVGLSGSRGVIRANSQAELTAALWRIRALLARPEIRAARAGLEDEILVESYISGAEFAIEGVLTRGQLTTFAIFDKPDPLEGPFFEETIYLAPSRLDLRMQQTVIDSVARAALAIGLYHGPIHAECRVSGTAVYVLEVAGRPIDGLCSRVLRFRDRYGAADEPTASLERVLLEHASGRSIDPWSRETAAAGVMMIPIPARGLLQRVDGEEAARRINGIAEVVITAKRQQLLEPLPEAGSYLGFIFARGRSAAAVEQALRDAHAHLRFQIDPAIAVRNANATA